MKYLLANYLLPLVVILIMLSACQDNHTSNTFVFEPYFSDEKLSCDQPVTINGQSWTIAQLQFYIANVEVKDKSGLWHALAMAVTPFQSNNLALVGANCQQSASQSNWNIAFERSFDLNNYTDVRFTLGVPFALNHLNPLQQESPLNMPSMFWVWRSGHKFLRLELLSTDQQSWMFHLGSTGCRSVSPVRSPSHPCLHPNQSVIELPITASNVFRFNLSALTQNMELNESANCQSEPENRHCQVLFERIGLTTNKQVLFEANRAN